jgi:glutathione S-transferase
MLLIGVNRSPFTRRVAITLNIYGVPFEQRALSGFDNRAEVRASNPLGRIPALVLDSGETLIDSNVIIDYLDEAYGGERPLTPRGGAERRAVLKVAAIMMGPARKLFTPPMSVTGARPKNCISPGSTTAWSRSKARWWRSMDDRSSKTLSVVRASDPGRCDRGCRRTPRAWARRRYRRADTPLARVDEETGGSAVLPGDGALIAKVRAGPASSYVIARATSS